MTARSAARAVLALAALLAPGAAPAARLPDWARPIADAAPALQEGVSERSARVLFREASVEVQPDGTLRKRLRIAKQALSVRADDDHVGVGWFPFNDRSKVRRSKAWHLPPGERAEKSSRLAEIDVTLGDEFLTDAKARAVAVDGLKRGSLVFFEFEGDDRPYALEYICGFGRAEDLQYARVAVELPPGWTLRSAWLRFDGPAPQVGGSTYTWEVRDLPAVDDEDDLAVPREDQEPALVIGLRPPPGAATPPAFEDWRALARWWEQNAADRAKVTPEIAAAAAALGPADAAPLVKVERSARYVRDRVRYVAREIGLDGYRPHPAGETLTALLGDCKDKATLLRALLAAQSLESWPVLVPLAFPGNIVPDLPALNAFDHVILAVRLPADASPPGDAVADGAALGRLLLVDPTSEWSSIGWLQSSLYGRQGLVLAGDASGLIRLPDASPDRHGVDASITSRLEPTGAVAYRVVRRLYGAPAASARWSWRAGNREYRAAVEADLARRFGAVTGFEHALEEESADGAAVETIRWWVPPGPDAPSLTWFPGVLDEVPRVALAKRKTEVRFRTPLRLHAENTVEGWPEALPVPAGRQSESERWSLAAAYEKQATALKARLDLTLRARAFPPAAIPELKKFYAAATSAAEGRQPLK